ALSSTLRAPPRSTPFPSTTLFRSIARARMAAQAPEARRGLTFPRHHHERGGLAEEQAGATAIERSHALARERAQRVEAPHDEARSEQHASELQSPDHLVSRLLPLK